MRNVRVVAQEFLPRNLLNSTVRAIAMPAGADKRVIWPNDHYVAARIRIVDLLRDDITSGPLLIGSKHPAIPESENPGPPIARRMAGGESDRAYLAEPGSASACRRTN